MNRYFLYLVLINMFINAIIFVPSILIKYSFDGAVASVLLSIPYGVLMTFLYSKAITKYPEKGLPEILANTTKWMKILHIWFIQLAFFTAGLITLLGFLDIISRFVNPEEPRLILLVMYLAAIFLVIGMPTQRVMYFAEIVLFFSIPFLGFIIFKAFSSKDLSWDSIWEVTTHVFDWPSLKAFAASSYVFSGYINLIIFNRVIKGKLKIWNYVFVFIVGILNLFTTFLIPIGYHGADGAKEYLFPWISTADSLRLVYSPVERVIFLFIMLYMGVTLISVSVHWHVALELVKSTFNEKAKEKKKWLVLMAIAICSAIMVQQINTLQLNQLTEYWMILRLAVEPIYVLSFYFWAGRKIS
ncbi:GerAB/ArcD/ProY family transporter [Neobacillus muris]|uniref:GerAB/ArcD/ProY family transporter n=1 Tax=Neobacillus muris TaxID=2941334 RepID=UPI00203CA9C1|nr:GerAB/ArcD/ProY family transporter [Neobacillus muris]